MNSKTYSAPWSLWIIFISAFTTVLCIMVSVYILRQGEGGQAWLALIPMLVIVGAALFTVRGYTLMPGHLKVHRLLWSTRVPLDGLQSVEFDPQAIHKSTRVLGNGGLFSMSGYFRSKSLGKFRAFVSHPMLAVILKFPDRTVVISPGIPSDFMQQIKDQGLLPEKEE